MALDDSYSKALLHLDGIDGSTTITDESGKTWTAVGNAQIDTAQNVFGGASLLLDGSGDYISTPDHDDWQLDGGSNSNEWTIDFRVRFNVDPDTGISAFFQQYVNTSNFWILCFNNNQLFWQIRSGGTNIVSLPFAWNPAAATWYHVALVKQGTTGYKCFVDGTQIGSTQTDTDVIPNFNGVLRVGCFTSTAGDNYYLNGWLDEIRISKGIARWTGNFTPPTAPYGAYPPKVKTWNGVAIASVKTINGIAIANVKSIQGLT